MSEAIKPKFWVDVHMNVMSAGGMVAFPCISAGLDQQQKNAILIAEALNARESTGLTPRQLVERVKELEEALKKIIVMNQQWAKAQWGDPLMAESMSCIKVARAALSKALPNTVAEVK